MTRRTVGMDLTEVNFELSPNSSSRTTDEQTFRYLFELICHSVNDPVYEDAFVHLPKRQEKPVNPIVLHDMMINNAPNSSHRVRGFSTKNSKKWLTLSIIWYQIIKWTASDGTIWYKSMTCFLDPPGFIKILHFKGVGLSSLCCALAAWQPLTFLVNMTKFMYLMMSF